jgi:hypothetical protein
MLLRRQVAVAHMRRGLARANKDRLSSGPGDDALSGCCAGGNGTFLQGDREGLD